MNHTANDLDHHQTEEETLTYEVSDEALEAASGAPTGRLWPVNLLSHRLRVREGRGATRSSDRDRPACAAWAAWRLPAAIADFFLRHSEVRPGRTLERAPLCGGVMGSTPTTPPIKQLHREKGERLFTFTRLPPNGAAPGQPTPSSGCTRSSSAG